MKVSGKQRKNGSPERLSLANHYLVHIACLVFLILVIYGNTLNAPFQWDENTFIVDNPIIKDLHFFTSPSEAQGFEYYGALMNRYVAYLTFALNYRIHGISVTGYHIVNIAIHIANSILVYFFVLLTFRTPYMRQASGVGRPGHSGSIAFFSAMLFAAHPLQTEAVTYVFQRCASLTAFFYLLSLVFYLKARLALTTDDLKKPRKVSWSSLSSPLWFPWLVLSVLSAVLAMKTKENAFTLPFVIALYEFCFFCGSARRILYLAPILLTLFIIPLGLGTAGGTSGVLDPGSYGVKGYSRGDYLFTQFRVIVTYLRLLFFPVDQRIDYDYPVYKSFFDPPVLLSAVFLSLLFGLGVYMIAGNRRWAIGNMIKAKGKEDAERSTNSRCLGTPNAARLLGFGILWFFITLSVESSIVPLTMLIDEYRVYLPSVGLIIGVVTGAFLIKTLSPKVGRLIPAILTVTIAVLSVATHLRNQVWTDTIRLWEDTAQKSPLNARVHFNLGVIYKNRDMPDMAREQYLTAIKLRPDFAEAYNNLGNIYQACNMLDKAEESYLRAVKFKPDYAGAHNNLGVIYQNLNMPDKAMEQYLITIKLKTDCAEAHNNLGVIYQARALSDKAIEQYLLAVKLKPDYAEAHFNLGFVYFDMGQKEKAQRELTAGLLIKPNDRQARQLLNMVSR